MGEEKCRRNRFKSPPIPRSQCCGVSLPKIGSGDRGRREVDRTVIAAPSSQIQKAKAGGSAPSPRLWKVGVATPLSAGRSGRTHQLGQEEGVGNGEEEGESSGHLGLRVAGGGRLARGHLSPAKRRAPRPRPPHISSCPTHPLDVAWEG